MSNYTRTTNFTAKDTLSSGNPSKVIKGSEFQAEFDNISTMSGTKADLISPTFTGTCTIPTAAVTTFTLGGTTVTATAAELNILDGVTATTAELNYMVGVTSDVQTQMDTKAPLASPTFTGTVTLPALVANTSVQLADSVTLGLGGANDLQLYHDGSNSYIEEAGTGSLYIKSDGAGVVFRNASDYNYATMLESTGETKLFYSLTGNDERLATDANGLELTGSRVSLNTAGLDIYTGTGSLSAATPLLDLRSDVAGSLANSAVLTVRGSAPTADVVDRKAGVALRLSSETNATESKKGYDIYAESALTFANNPDFFIERSDGTKRIKAANTGEVVLYHNDSEKLATESGGVAVTGVADVDQLRVTTPTVPASASATGTAGDIAWDADYIYVCVATDTWKRVLIATW